MGITLCTGVPCVPCTDLYSPFVTTAQNAPSDPFRFEQHQMSTQKRHLRGKAETVSEGVLSSGWAHRDLPTEIHKLYTLRQQIGTGTTAQVFLAIRKLNQKALACKVIAKPRGYDDADKLLLRQLRREIKVLQRLSHPNVIRYETMVETSSTIYCFMELLTGGELFEHLVEHGPMAQVQAAFMMHGIVSAIAHMHSRGVVHRDIKAENLMLVNRASIWPVAKLIDFGFATELNFNLPATNSFLGTAGYLAPEIRQRRDYSKTVDVWALGVLTHLVLTCQLPFDISIDDLPTNRQDVKNYFDLRFDETYWPRPHTDAVQSLIRRMLDVDAASRFNAEECLRTPWLSGKHFNYSFADTQLTDETQAPKKAKSTPRCLSMPELTKAANWEEDDLSQKHAESPDADFAFDF